MKNSWKLGGRIAFVVCMVCVSVPVIAMSQAYYRVENYVQTPAPKPNGTQFTMTGQEIVPYAYGYVYNLPEDGNWRYIEARCYQSNKGQTCIDAHWIKKTKGKCEEVTAHYIRTGNYIKLVPQGKVSTCK